MNEDFVILLKQDRQKAFNLLFDQFFHPLCSFGYRYMGDISAVEDMVQDVFIRFWETADSFEHPQAIKAYLYTSVRNKCLNYLKHEKVKQKNESGLIYELESEQFFSGQIIEEETFKHLHSEISELPVESQKIMLLVLNGLKNKDIAEKLRISENTVKTQKKIAYSKLRSRLGTVFQAVLLSF